MCLREGKPSTHRDRNADIAFLVGLVCLFRFGKRLRPFCYAP